MIRWTAGFLLLACAAPAGFVAGQVPANDPPAELRVMVAAYGTDKPLAGARITLRTGQAILQTLTNPQGQARITGIPPGTHVLRVEAFGYGAEEAVVAFDAGATVEAELDLVVAPFHLEPLTVTSERQHLRLATRGFYERQRFGHGRFLGPELIDQRASEGATLLELFRGVSGLSVRVVTQMARTGYTVVASRGFALDRCTPEIYLDGMIFVSSRSALAGDPFEVERSLRSVPTSQVAGIEVYSAATAPAQYRAGGCGAILIWTR